MAKLVRDPFDGDNECDIDVVEEIDYQLYAATTAIYIENLN